MTIKSIKTMTDEDIGRYFAGSFGPDRMREAIALMRRLAEIAERHGAI